MAELSHTSPRRPMLQVIPNSASNDWKRSLVLLASLIRMMQQPARLTSSPDRHDQGIGHQLRCHLLTHRPTHDSAGEQIKDNSKIQPAFILPKICEIGNPALVRCRRLKLPIEQVRRNGMCSSYTAVARQSTSLGAGLKARPKHQAGYTMLAAAITPSDQIAPHAWTSIGAIALLEAIADHPQKLTVSFGPITLGSVQPLVEPRSRDTQRLAHQLRLPDAAALGDKRELHGGSLANKEMAVFKMSRSVLVRASSLRSWASSASSGFITPRPGKALLLPKAASRTQRSSTFSSIPKSRAACETLTPRSLTSFTASSLNSRVNILRVPIPHLRDHLYNLSRCLKSRGKPRVVVLAQRSLKPVRNAINPVCTEYRELN